MLKFYKWKKLIILIKMEKQDKMVIFAGILILIIAIAGIIYHEKTYVVGEEIKEIEYKVTWIDKSNEFSIKDYVGKEGWQEEYDISLDKNANIYLVEIKLEWKDNFDFHGIIFPWNFTDKMSINVKIDELDFSKSLDGYGKIEMRAEGKKINDMLIKAKNETEVIKMLNNMTKNKATCKINLSIFPKPRFFDKGNDFSLYVVYRYSIPVIEPA